MLNGIKQTRLECKRFLNKKDPLDRLIFEFVKDQKLDIGFVPTSESQGNIRKYTRKSLPDHGKHT